MWFFTLFLSLRIFFNYFLFVHVYFRVRKKKPWNKNGPYFWASCFWFSQGKVKHAIRQLEKPPEALENLLYTCFKCESNKIFSIAKKVRSTDEGKTVFNKCRDCHNKWRDWLCGKYPIEIACWVFLSKNTNHNSNIGSFRIWWQLYVSLLIHVKWSPHTWFSTLNPRACSFRKYEHACFDFLKKSLTTTNSSFVKTLFSSCIILRSALSFGYHTNMALACLFKFFGMAE